MLAGLVGPQSASINHWMLTIRALHSKHEYSTTKTIQSEEWEELKQVFLV